MNMLDKDISLIKKAFGFAYRVHQVDQFQMRKGKLVPYILHPLSVANRLQRAGADPQVIAAGLLHDTIEDCKPQGSVTKSILQKEFGIRIAEMVDDVTEQDRSLSWEERKQQALDHVKDLSHDSVLLKSADVLDNLSDQIEDYKLLGDKMFESYNAPKSAQLTRYRKLVYKLLEVWPDNPLATNLHQALQTAERLWA